MDIFWAAPLITRTLTAATVFVSVLAHTGIVLSPYYLAFIPQNVYKKFPPELWRLETPFLLTPPGLGMIFSPYFLWMYGCSLEKDSPRFRRKADFCFYLLILQLIILVVDGNFLNGFFFNDPFLMGLTYTFSQENPNQIVTLIILQLRARYLPLAKLILSFVLGGPMAAIHEATGIIAAHLYEFLSSTWPKYAGGRNYIQTPQFLQKRFEQYDVGSEAGGGTNRGPSAAQRLMSGRGRRLGGD